MNLCQYNYCKKIALLYFFGFMFPRFVRFMADGDAGPGGSGASSPGGTAGSSGSAAGAGDSGGGDGGDSGDGGSGGTAGDTGTDEKSGKSDKGDKGKGEDIAALNEKIDALAKENKRYKDAEQKAKEDKLKADGKLNELIAEKEKAMNELKTKLDNMAKVEAVKKLLTENKADESFVNSDLTKAISQMDIFDENLNIKKDSFKGVIQKAFPFLAEKRAPNATVPAPIPNDKSGDYDKYFSDEVDRMEKERGASAVTFNDPRVFFNNMTPLGRKNN
jgi:hypothetical protein